MNRITVSCGLLEKSSRVKEHCMKPNGGVTLGKYLGLHLHIKIENVHFPSC